LKLTTRRLQTLYQQLGDVGGLRLDIFSLSEFARAKAVRQQRIRGHEQSTRRSSNIFENKLTVAFSFL